MGTVSLGDYNANSSTSPVTSGTVGAGQTLASDNAATAVALNSARTSVTIAITGSNVWIRLLPAATDAAVRKGTPVAAGEVWELPAAWWKSLYTGEISIINAVDGQTPTYYVTEL